MKPSAKERLFTEILPGMKAGWPYSSYKAILAGANEAETVPPAVPVPPSVPVLLTANALAEAVDRPRGADGGQWEQRGDIAAQPGEERAWKRAE